MHFRQQPLLRGTSSRVSVPPIHSIPCTALESAQPLTRRSGAPCDVRYLRAVYVKDNAINTYSTNRNGSCVVPVLGSRRHWSRDEPLGRCPSFHGGPLGQTLSRVINKNTQREGSYPFSDSKMAKVGVKAT